MRPVLAVLALGAAACGPQYIDTLAPKDAHFELACGESCGKGHEPSVIVDVVFGGHYSRKFELCCGQRNAVVARLVTVRDMWCAGLAVPPKSFGDVTVGTTVSEINEKRAATLDQGEGYVAFQCDDWLPKLIDRLNASNCCAAK